MKNIPSFNFTIPKRKRKKNPRFVIGPGDPMGRQTLPRGYDGRGYAAGVNQENGNVVGFPVATAIGSAVGDGGGGGMGESIDNPSIESIYSYACVLCNLSNLMSRYIAELVKTKINPDDLYIDPVEGIDGIEDSHHISILYGIIDEDDGKIENLLNEVAKKLPKVTFGKISRFDNHPQIDVIKIDIGSELDSLHEEIKGKIENTPVHDSFKPHITLAYVKKGCCPELDGLDLFAGMSEQLTNICYADRYGNQVEYVG